MNTTLHPALVEAYALAKTTVTTLHTLEIRHVQMSNPLFFVQGFINRQMFLETSEEVVFQALAFNMVYPPSDESGLQDMTITLDNVDNMISDFLEACMNFPDAVEVIYRPYLSNDYSQPQMDPPLELYLVDASITATQVACRARPMDYLNMKFPSELYTRERFPALGN